MEKNEKKRATNKAHYLKSKGRQEAALLRFDVGDLKIFDDAKDVAGLARSAFAKLYLLPIAMALAARFDAVEAARATRAISLETFIGQALDAALAAAPRECPSVAIAADEFDQLFGSAD